MHAGTQEPPPSLLNSLPLPLSPLCFSTPLQDKAKLLDVFILTSFSLLNTLSRTSNDAQIHIAKYNYIPDQRRTTAQLKHGKQKV